mmetsp:Transcript_7428/g.23436  ORF Transcript_7428/g.23436 Transcript_7428/m.23436 type:complete len:494 (+) Transcript_7428:408-1889(+)
MKGCLLLLPLSLLPRLVRELRLLHDGGRHVDNRTKDPGVLRLPDWRDGGRLARGDGPCAHGEPALGVGGLGEASVDLLLAVVIDEAHEEAARNHAPDHLPPAVQHDALAPGRLAVHEDVAAGGAAAVLRDFVEVLQAGEGQDLGRALFAHLGCGSLPVGELSEALPEGGVGLKVLCVDEAYLRHVHAQRPDPLYQLQVEEQLLAAQRGKTQALFAPAGALGVDRLLHPADDVVPELPTHVLLGEQAGDAQAAEGRDRTSVLQRPVLHDQLHGLLAPELGPGQPDALLAARHAGGLAPRHAEGRAVALEVEVQVHVRKGIRGLLFDGPRRDSCCFILCSKSSLNLCDELGFRCGLFLCLSLLLLGRDGGLPQLQPQLEVVRALLLRTQGITRGLLRLLLAARVYERLRESGYAHAVFVELLSTVTLAGDRALGRSEDCAQSEAEHGARPRAEGRGGDPSQRKRRPFSPPPPRRKEATLAAAGGAAPVDRGKSTT